MRNLLLTGLVLLSLSACNNGEEPISKAKKPMAVYAISKAEFENKVSRIVPFENISLSKFAQMNVDESETTTLTFVITNPEVDVQNDSLLAIKSTMIKEAIKEEVSNIDDYNNYGVSFKKLITTSKDLEKVYEVSYIYSNESE